MGVKYIVVENAGYKRERDISEFVSYRQAVRYISANYSNDEVESLHVDIATEIHGVRTF